ncbi:hypothetical protein ABT144_32870 [Streptomyces sp. NPDC002039]|uniref:hypothetical protein n=1 Tax=unclassified Streptomyces TaxID=2593676 RepID=UPI00331E002F
MDIRRMRRTRDDLLHDITLNAPAAPGELFAALCDAMSRRHRVPMEHHLVSFPVSTVSGLLVKTKARNLVLIEADTDPEHQLGILGHEFWHVEADDGRTGILGESDFSTLFSPDVTATDIQRIAARTNCEEHEEAECELFGSLLAMKGKRWLDTDSSPAITSAFGRKLSVSLGPGRGVW